MLNYPYLHFINLEYWYCIFYSVFGGICGAVPPTSEGGDIGGAVGSGVVGGGATGTAVPGLWDGIGSGLSSIGHVFFGIGSVLWSLFGTITYTISGFLILLILLSLLGLLYIRYKELPRYHTLIPGPRVINPFEGRWGVLLEDATSNDPKRWRRAIVEADGMLGELLLKLTYPGKTTAERLRNVPEGAFVTLPAAWEAHRIKNFSVAQVSSFILTQREAFRVMKLFEQVFEEFNFV